MTLQEILESVRRVEMRTNRLVNDMMVGAYLSHFKGRGMDFEELRDYIPGDDVRDIDWNVTNRMGRPFVKTLPRGARTGRHPGAGYFGLRAPSVPLRRSKRESAVEIAATLAAFRRAQQRQGGPAAVHRPGRSCFCRRARAAAIFCGLIKEMLFFQPKHSGHRHPGGADVSQPRRQAALDRFSVHRFSAQLRRPARAACRRAATWSRKSA